MLAVLAAATIRPVVAARAQQQPQQVPVFRSAVTLVPLDVRVTDKNGKPVTDLRQDEFTIVDDGAR